MPRWNYNYSRVASMSQSGNRGRGTGVTANTRGPYGSSRGRGGRGGAATSATPTPDSRRRPSSSTAGRGRGRKRGRMTLTSQFGSDEHNNNEYGYNSGYDSDDPMDRDEEANDMNPSQEQEAEGGGAANDEHMGETETYAAYKPAKLTIGNPHPDSVVETASLASVPPPDISFTLKLPNSIIEKGKLSALQLEAIVYACQKHEQKLESGERAGYLIGDGAGVGKGRTIAGIILDNYIRGRKKAIWISVSSDLLIDAERDFKDIGASKMAVHALNKTKYGPLRFGDKNYGVVFATYSALIGCSAAAKGLNTRLKQLIAWFGEDFDGVIVFDECHRAKNLWPASGSKPTKTGQAVAELQRILRNARVVYASATGASEPRNMAYMARLGLWGAGTTFSETKHFVEALEKRGISAMELVAMDLKLRGNYLARQLSFQGVTFSIEYVTLTDEFVAMYNDSVNWWVDYFNKMMGAIKILIFETNKNGKKKGGMLRAQYWAAHQRFFKYLCLAAKVDQVCEIAKKAVNEDDQCVVIGLQSTGEARTADMVEKADFELDEFVSTAKGVMEYLIANQFPTPGPALSNSEEFYTEYEEIRKKIVAEKGFFDSNSSRLQSLINKYAEVWPNNTKFVKSESESEPDFDADSDDSDGTSHVPGSRNFSFKTKQSKKQPPPSILLQANPEVPSVSDVEEAFQARLELKAGIENIGPRLPKNTLDRLIEGLGGYKKVAEMTGRKNRLLKTNNKVEYCSRGTADVSLDQVNIDEKNKFMQGKKLIAIISEAASCGISLQSDRRVINQRRRLHITIELPWSADKAIQQFGRTHRSNQAAPPQYMLLVTDLAGENRFASAVAKRLETLGALTHGDRRAQGNMSRFQMDNKYGKKALHAVMTFVQYNTYPPVKVKIPDELAEQRVHIYQGLQDVGVMLDPVRDSTKKPNKSITIPVFLNRLLGLPTALQNFAFSYFSLFLDAYIAQDKRLGRFEFGLRELGAADKTVVVESKFFALKHSTGMGKVVLHKLEVERGMTWEETQDRYSRLRGRFEGYYISDQEHNAGNKLCLLAISESHDPDNDRDYDLYTVLKPFCGVQQNSVKLEGITAAMHKVEPEIAKKYWINQYEKSNSLCYHRFRYSSSTCHLKIGQQCLTSLRKLNYYVISGNVLLVWENIEEHLKFTAAVEGRKEHIMKIVRAQNDSGFTAIGLLVPGKAIERLITEMEKLSSGAPDPDAPGTSVAVSSTGVDNTSNNNNDNITTA